MVNTSVSAGGVVISHNWPVGGYYPETAIFIDLDGETDAVVSVVQAKALRDALTKIIDEVEARKPKEKTLPEKLADLPDGTVIEYRGAFVGAHGYQKYHKIAGKFYRATSGESFPATDFPGIYAKAFVDGKEL